MPTFKEGDIVILKSGTARQRVLETRDGPTAFMIRTSYLSDLACNYDVSRKWRRASDFYLDKSTSTEETENDMAKTVLYQTKPKAGETLEFGTLLARNSFGQLVLEMKGTGAVRAFDVADLEEVRPYTVELRDHNGLSVHRESTPDVVKPGDILMRPQGNMALYTVIAVDTKHASPRGSISGWDRLVTEQLPGRAELIAARQRAGDDGDDGDE